MFDPSPLGWIIPSTEVFKVEDFVRENTANQYYEAKGLRFPLNGYRTTNGSLSVAGEDFRCWLAKKEGQNGGALFIASITNMGVTYSGNYASAAFSIRPIQIAE